MKRIRILFPAITMAILLIFSGCNGRPATSGTPETTAPTTQSTGHSDPPVIKDNIPELDEDTLIDIMVHYFVFFGFDENFTETDRIPYEQAYRFIKNPGVFGGTDPDDSVRPELRPYYNRERELFTLPAQTVDAYVCGKFNTVVDRSKITEYNADDDTYMFEPFMWGAWDYIMEIDGQPEREGSKIRVSYIATPDADMVGEVRPPNRGALTLRFENGEYAFLSHEGTTDKSGA